MDAHETGDFNLLKFEVIWLLQPAFNIQSSSGQIILTWLRKKVPDIFVARLAVDGEETFVTDQFEDLLIPILWKNRSTHFCCALSPLTDKIDVMCRSYGVILWSHRAINFLWKFTIWFLFFLGLLYSLKANPQSCNMILWHDLLLHWGDYMLYHFGILDLFLLNCLSKRLQHQYCCMQLLFLYVLLLYLILSKHDTDGNGSINKNLES